MIEVTLSAVEMLMASQAAAWRRISNIAKARAGAHGFSNARNGWQADNEGALAEVAAAKGLNLYWSAGSFGAPDVGGLYDVRSTPYATGHLVIYPKDESERKFILAVGADAHWELRGWLYARECKQAQYWTTHTVRGKPCLATDPGAAKLNDACFYVPQIALHPMNTIKEQP